MDTTQPPLRVSCLGETCAPLAAQAGPVAAAGFADSCGAEVRLQGRRMSQRQTPSLSAGQKSRQPAVEAARAAGRGVSWLAQPAGAQVRSQGLAT
jgi:hypothetical protein